MIIATHIILTGYGHWLPNDPRGSSSQEAKIPKIAKLGEVHRGRKEEQPPRQEVRAFYKKAKPVLSFSTRWFNDQERQIIAGAFGDAISREQLTCYACSIMRDHIHILIRRHGIKAAEITGLLTDSAKKALVQSGRFGQDHPVFNAGLSNFFKSTPDQVWGNIGYINENFIKHGLPFERYPFVTDYDGWR